MIEIASIATVVVLTYLVLQVLPRPERILLSANERARYTAKIIGKFGAFVYVANVVGALTSLATVYVFFIGTTQLFGYFIFVCIISIAVSGSITTKLTNALLAQALFRERLQVDTPTAAAITSLFWTKDDYGASKLIKLLTQVSLLAILWLEFATLAKISIGLFGLQSIGAQSFVMFISAFLMFDFIIRNGLRGFLFADLLEFPLILIGFCGVLIGTFILATKAGSLDWNLLLAQPKFPIWWCLIFVIATLFLNSFLILTSEAHWLRVWTMRDQVQSSTSVGTLTTAGVWLLLIGAGLMAPLITEKVGVSGVVEVISKLSATSVIFGIAFWIAAIAAMFSTTDAQIYSFLVVSAFETKTGTIDSSQKFIGTPLLSSLAIALCFAALYAIIEETKYPFEPIVFFIFPIFLCVVPAFVQAICSGHATTAPIAISILMYLSCGVGMLIFPSLNFPLSLAAPLMPALVSTVLYVSARLRGRS